MSQSLLELAKRALMLKNSGQHGEAAALYEVILSSQPDWEHGYGAFSLAECYEEQGDIRKAELAYETAVSTNPTDPVLLGGHASFLYLHREASQAFDAYLNLLALDLAQSNAQGAAGNVLALNELGRRMGLSQEAIDARIARASTGKEE
jgi:tetratricopeptide (TPR) repeat protein